MNSSRSRTEKIESYGRAHPLLKDSLARFPKEMWSFRPAENQWSIHEIVIHLVDSEANSYIRCRRLIAEPGRDLMAYDENQWARVLNYENQSIEAALELFRWLRERTWKLVQTLTPAVWEHQAFHPEDGVITLDDWLDTYERHVPDHVAQMDDVHRQWLAGQSQEASI